MKTGRPAQEVSAEGDTVVRGPVIACITGFTIQEPCDKVLPPPTIVSKVRFKAEARDNAMWATSGGGMRPGSGA